MTWRSDIESSAAVVFTAACRSSVTRSVDRGILLAFLPRAAAGHSRHSVIQISLPPQAFLPHASKAASDRTHDRCARYRASRLAVGRVGRVALRVVRNRLACSHSRGYRRDDSVVGCASNLNTPSGVQVVGSAGSAAATTRSDSEYRSGRCRDQLCKKRQAGVGLCRVAQRPRPQAPTSLDSLSTQKSHEHQRRRWVPLCR